MSLHGGMPYIDGPSHVYIKPNCGSSPYMECVVRENIQTSNQGWLFRLHTPSPPEFFSLALYFSSKFGY